VTHTDDPLASNAELHRYLLQTAELLTLLGRAEQADKVRRAAAQGAGLGTEFLGESKIALLDVLRTSGNVMDVADRNRVAAVIEQLEKALNRR
jgi:hypothetical protein